MNTTKLHKLLSELFTGYSFRGKVENDSEGNLCVIQMKDLKNNYSSISKDLTIVDSAKISDKYLLQNGDVLFISKGSNNHAIKYTSNETLTRTPTIASSTFFVLRPDQSKVIPEYLTWYLNQNKVQQYLNNNRAGTQVLNLNKAAVEGIEVELPDINTQGSIAKSANLLNKEQEIRKRLLELRTSLINHQLMNSINK